jgi:hypothetical protein
VRAEYEKLVQSLRPERGTQKDYEIAVTGTKMLVYNKAYIYYSCIMSLGPSGNFTNEQLSRCVEEKMRPVKRWFGLGANYASVIGDQRSVRCEMRTRMFEAELEFPPYDFLKDKEVALYDVAKMNECLLAE